MFRKKRLFFLSLFLFFTSYLWGQGARSELSLNLDETSGKIENQIQFEINSRDLKRLYAITGQKASFRATQLRVNGKEVIAKDIHTRGQTTLNFPRKSLSFDLEKSVKFNPGSREVRMKHFILLNLSMDKYYVRNRLAFGMLQELGLVNFYYSYANLEINQSSQGIYFLVERPQDWAINELGSPIVIRRGYGHSVEKAKSPKSQTKEETKGYLDSFKEIYKLIGLQSGEELYQSLSQRIDLENYMRWMAFNYLVKNGDYADEVFFYIDPNTGLFKIIPWDYDDIFSAIPHEGKSVGSASPTKYIFSKEDNLDKKIAEDPFLYSKYLTVLKEVSASLTPELLKENFENTFAELYPYYSDPTILQNVKTDLYSDADLEKLKTELSLDFLLIQGVQRLISLEIK
jgi:spore coat protein H